MARISKPKKAFVGALMAAPMLGLASMKAKGATKKLQKEAPKMLKMMGGMPPVGDNGKKVRLKEDSRAYITKIKTDDKGDITSLKSRRTVKGLLSGAPRAKKIMKNGGKITKKSAPKSKKK